MLDFKSGYRKELLSAIEEARVGMLSPHWEEYLYREIESEKGTENYPDDGDELFAKIRHLTSTIPQISDYEHEKQFLEKNGNKLLYHYVNNDYYTCVQIIFQAEWNTYEASIFFDKDTAISNPAGYAAKVKTDFDHWVAGQAIPELTALDLTNIPDICVGRYNTLEEAIRHIYAALEMPEKLLA